MLLGKGSFGSVSEKDGDAVKKFKQLNHLIQEYVALKYLHGCNHIVQLKGVNFVNLELHMKLYDSSLRDWLLTKRETQHIMKVIRDILMGLVEMHDRQLVHGDLTPRNILIRNYPLKAVIGDCGFVSYTKYAKVRQTAPLYSESETTRSSSHDMFSFGVCFLEMIADIRINKPGTYEELKLITDKTIKSPKYREIIYNLLGREKGKEIHCQISS